MGKAVGSCGGAGGELQCHKATWCELWDKPLSGLLTGAFVSEPTLRFCRVACVFILGHWIDFNDQFTLFKTTQTT